MSRNIIVHTKSDTNLCRRCVKSVCAALRSWDAIIWVFDDARSDFESAQIISLLRTLEKEEKFRIKYVGRKVRLDLQNYLIQCGFSPELVAFGTEGCGDSFSVGAMRNVAQLLMVGNEYISMDDDVVLDLIAANGLQSKLLDTGYSYPQSFDFNEMQKPSPPYKRIVFADFSRVADKLLRDSCHQVPVVQCGIWGDSAWRTSDWLFSASQDLFRRLNSSDEECFKSLTSRSIIRMPNFISLTKSPNCMTYFAGFSKNYPFAPFPPLYRNSDGVFGVVLHLANREAIRFGQIPCAVCHLPSPSRHGYQDGTKVRVPDLLIDSLRRSNLALGTDISENYLVIGRFLMDCLRLSAREFLRSNMAHLRAARLQEIQDALDRVRSGSVLEMHLFGLFSKLKAAETSSETLPIEIHSGNNDHLQALDALGSYISKYGELLAQWSDIRSAMSNSPRETWTAT